MQAVVALIGLEAALADMHADDGIRRDAERLQSFEIGRHVGLADQHVAHADVFQVIAQGRLADAQWPAVPVRAVRAHVAAGVETHPRRAADRRLHIGVGEAHAALRHRIDVRGLQRGVAGTAQIIIAKLVAHDPEDVFRTRHARMLRYQADNDKRLTRSRAPLRRRSWPCRRPAARRRSRPARAALPSRLRR